MDCQEIQHKEIAEKYILGELPETLKEQYENHYLSCDKCSQELVLLQKMVTSIREKSAQEAIQTEKVKPAWKAGQMKSFINMIDNFLFHPARPLAIGMTVLLLFLIYPAILGLISVPGLRDEIQKLRNPVLITNHFSLFSPQELRTQITDDLNLYTINQETEQFIINIGHPLIESDKIYKIQIFDDKNRIMWKTENAKPSGPYSTFSLSFHRNFFQEGTYKLTVSCKEDKVFKPIQGYSFQIRINK